MDSVNIVSGFSVMTKFSTCKYFSKNLGFVSTLDENGKRVFNKKDIFSFTYNRAYKSTLHAQGNIGNIKFYTDHYIEQNKFGVYYGDDFEEFIFEFDENEFKNKGPEKYLGGIIKKVEKDFNKMKEEGKIEKPEVEKQGVPDNIVKNPGAVTYEDLKEYIKNKKQKGIN